MSTIAISHITKDYGKGRGVFNASFAVEQGEVMGFLGPNGAGKTTTIRQLMGFIRPHSGSVRIFGKDCFASAAEIQKNVGYLPGEIAFMDDMTGTQFLRFMGEMKGLKTQTRAEELARFFALDASGRIKKMSKGMKQKIGIVCAFMANPALYILDEPTSGLDPLMQGKFLELIQEEKARGKTILMSSHMFEEIERTCSRTVIIKAGHIVAVETMERLRSEQKRRFSVQLQTTQEAQRLAAQLQGSVCKGVQVLCSMPASAVDIFLKTVAGYAVIDLQQHTQTLEELFLHFYGEGETT